MVPQTAEFRADTVWNARVDLAAALRWASRLGFGEGVCNHFSVMPPGGGGHCLINPFGRHWAEMLPGDLLLLDDGGAVIDGSGEVEATAFHIHSRLHRHRPDAVAVLHTHMPHATALTMIDGGRLEPSHQSALRFYGAIAYDDHYNGLALDAGEGDRLAAAMGEARILFMANHGVIVTGPSVAEAFDALYYLERACQVHLLALSTGRPLRVIPEDVAKRTRAQFDQDARPYASAHFEALKRMLKAETPDFDDRSAAMESVKAV